MKLFRLTGFLGTAAIALLLTASSCKKSSSNSTTLKQGTMTFTMNGKTVNMVASADTTGQVIIAGVGALSAGDTAQVTLYLNVYGGAYAATYTGNFADSSILRNGSAGLIDLTKGYQMYDDYTGASTSVFDVNLTSNNGIDVSGSFSGWVYLNSGAGPDSTNITNGKFNVQL